MSAETLHYRTGTRADIGALALVMERANAFRDGQPLPTFVDDHGDTAANLLIRMNKPGAWTHLAADQERIAGFAHGYPYMSADSEPTGDSAEYVSLLMVDPDYWGKGIASKLLDIVADRARHADKRHVLLWTLQNDNAHARTVYEHKGYVVTGQTRMSQHGFGEQVQYALDLE